MKLGGSLKRAVVTGVVVLVAAGCSVAPSANMAPTTAVATPAASATPTAAPLTRPAPDAADVELIRAALRNVDPDLNTPDAIEQARDLCSGEDRKTWDHAELIKDTQAKFGDPVGITLAPAEAQAILTSVLESFCHA